MKIESGSKFNWLLFWQLHFFKLFLCQFLNDRSGKAVVKHVARCTETVPERNNHV